MEARDAGTASAQRGRPRRGEQSVLDAACSAVAHSGRRAILDLLARQGTLSAGQIAAAFPQLSRQGVSAQLRTLRQARLVAAVRPAAAQPPGVPASDGRELRYRLSPQPLELVERWVQRYRSFWTDKLEELAMLVEATPPEAAAPAQPPERHPVSGMATPYPATLQGERVRLVPLTEEHWPDVKASQAQRELWKYAAAMETEDQFRAYLDTALEEAATGRSVVFAVYAPRRSGGWDFAGSTRIANIAVEHGRVEIGWTWVLPQFQRTGLNRAAKLLLLTHCFETLGCRRVEFKGHGQNMKSRNALAGIGATFEGVLRWHMVLPDGSPRDSFYFSIIAPEWPAVKAQLAAKVRP